MRILSCMQSLNHDMDELFRKAGENYPLNPGNGDWNSLSGKISGAAGAASLKRKRRIKYYQAALLLLSLLVISGWFLLSDNISSLGDPKQPDDFKTDITKNNHTQNKMGPGKHQPGAYIEGESATGKNAHVNINLFSPTRLNKRTKVMTNEKQLNKIHNADPALQRLKPIKYNPSISAYSLKDSIKALPHISNLLLTAPDTTKTKVSKNKAVTIKHKGLYIGLLGGPDFSEVRSQGITKAGYVAGILLGYRFNRLLSVESGVLWSKKKYYSDGKYFSLSKVGSSMPAGMEIMSVEGQSSLFEIPLKIKYDLIRKEKSDIFLTAGISSNVYVKEKNNYLTKMNGVLEQQTGLYDNLPCSWFSLINISAGYEHSLGRTHSIRFEPYIKLPLKKVGMGNMPVFSAGITLAVSNLLSGQ